MLLMMLSTIAADFLLKIHYDFLYEVRIPQLTERDYDKWLFIGVFKVFKLLVFQNVLINFNNIKYIAILFKNTFFHHTISFGYFYESCIT